MEPEAGPDPETPPWIPGLLVHGKAMGIGGIENDKILESPLNLEDFRLVFIIEKGKGLFLAKNLLGTGRHPNGSKTNQSDPQRP
jgi:hypothetical protein